MGNACPRTAALVCATVRCVEGRCDLTRLSCYAFGFGAVQQLGAKLQPREPRSSQSKKVINSLHMSSGLRWKFVSNNWGYEIASQVCKEVGGETWDAMLHSKFSQPLGLQRTDASGHREKLSNVVKAYLVLDDRTPVPIPKTPMSGQTFMGAAGGVESCIDDLLVLYRSILEASITQFGSNQKTTPNNPF